MKVRALHFGFYNSEYIHDGDVFDMEIGEGEKLPHWVEPVEETTQGTPTQETTQGTPTQETTQGTPTQETTQGTPTQETPQGTPTQETPQGTSDSGVSAQDVFGTGSPSSNNPL